MSLSGGALEALNEHWAVSAIGAEELARASELINQRLARRAVGKQISFSFEENSEDEPFLERVALAFELAAIEGLDELSRPSGEQQQLRNPAVAASFRAFDVRRLLPVPAETHDRLFFVLQLSAAAYCGDRWSDLRRWYREQRERGVEGAERRGSRMGPQALVQAVRLLGQAYFARMGGTIWTGSARSSPGCATTRRFTRNAVCKMVRRLETGR